MSKRSKKNKSTPVYYRGWIASCDDGVIYSDSLAGTRKAALNKVKDTWAWHNFGGTIRRVEVREIP